MAKYRLLSCPFCGSKKIDVRTISIEYKEGCLMVAVCMHCAAQGPIEYCASTRAPGKAIDAWNERYNEK